MKKHRVSLPCIKLLPRACCEESKLDLRIQSFRWGGGLGPGPDQHEKYAQHLSKKQCDFLLELYFRD